MNRSVGRVFMIGAMTAFLYFAVLAQSRSGYHVVNKFTLGGEGGWDYVTVDSRAHAR